jgi:hypothetical protein
MQGVKGPQYTEITKTAIIVGRNNIPVPMDEVETMAQIGCTDREIAEHFGIKEDTLRRNFADYLIKGRSMLKQRLRQAQLRVAFEGNPTMLIWLGRNILGQNENIFANDDNKILPFTDDELDEIKEDLQEEYDQLNAADSSPEDNR